MHLDHVAGGAGDRRHDRGLTLRNAIEQRRLAGIGRPGDHHPQALAQALAARGAGKRRVDLVGQRPSERERAVDEILRHVAFVGKIDRGLDLRQRLDRARAPGLGAIAEQAAHLLQRLPPLRLGVGADQVGERLDLGEVELAVLEGAAGELAGLRHPQARDPAERRQRGGDHGAAAVELELGHVLAGLAARRRETTAPAPDRSARRRRGRARWPAPPCAAPARGRSAPRAPRGRAGRISGPRRSRPAAGRRRGRRWCRWRRSRATYTSSGPAGPKDITR